MLGPKKLQVQGPSAQHFAKRKRQGPDMGVPGMLISSEGSWMLSFQQS